MPNNWISRQEIDPEAGGGAETVAKRKRGVFSHPGASPLRR